MIAQHLATLGCVGGGSSSTSDSSGSSSSGRSSGSIQTPGSAISVVGHSLGAAMACLQAFQMAGDPAVNIRESTRMANPGLAFADAFDARMRTRGVVHYHVTSARPITPAIGELPLRGLETHGEVYYNATQLQAYKICPLAGDQLQRQVEPPPGDDACVRPLQLLWHESLQLRLHDTRLRRAALGVVRPPREDLWHRKVIADACARRRGVLRRRRRASHQ